MISIIYVSAATDLMSDEELLQLLQKSRENNKKRNVTGMLLYHDGNFIQVLEGEEADVIALVQKIEQDPRHRTMIKLVRETITERSFPNWSMGFQNIDKLNEEDREAISDYLKTPWASQSWSEQPGKAQKLLAEFKRNLR